MILNIAIKISAVYLVLIGLVIGRFLLDAAHYNDKRSVLRMSFLFLLHMTMTTFMVWGMMAGGSEIQEKVLVDENPLVKIQFDTNYEPDQNAIEWKWTEDKSKFWRE